MADYSLEITEVRKKYNDVSKVQKVKYLSWQIYYFCGKFIYKCQYILDLKQSQGTFRAKTKTKLR